MLDALNPPKIHRVVWHNFVYPPGRLAQHEIFQNRVVALSEIVEMAERNLLARPELIVGSVTGRQLNAALRMPWLLPVTYGHMIEHYVEARRQRIRSLRDLDYQQGQLHNRRKKVDWRFAWQHVTDPTDRYHGFEQRIDLTTVGQVPKKHHSYGKTALAVIMHDVPDCSDLELFFRTIRELRDEVISVDQATERMQPAAERWHATLDSLADVRQMRANQGVDPGMPIDSGRKATREHTAQLHQDASLGDGSGSTNTAVTNDLVRTYDRRLPTQRETAGLELSIGR